MAERTGFLAHPSSRGVHREPTPLLGGVALFLAFCLGLGIGVAVAGLALPTRILGFLAGGLLVFVMGVIDDRADLSWFSKLLGQIFAAVLLLASGNTAGEFFLSPIGLVLSLLWIVGLTNAMNFLDNMDGICTGIAAVASATLGVLALISGRIETAILATSLCGASLGFLRFNFPPARIFLGDGGSLFLGYSLASLSLMAMRGTELSFSLLIPTVVLAYPIFDITFVSATRYARGQSLTQGGKDHTSHRLARITGSDRATAWVIFGICSALGIVALVFHWIAFAPATVVLSLAVAFAFLAFGVRLTRLAPVPDPAPSAGATVS